MTVPLKNTALRLNRASPWMTLGILMLSLGTTTQSDVDNVAMVQRNREIAESLASVPLIVGEWIGEEQPLTPSAIELLRPNASLSRRWSKIGSRDTLGMSFIHCSDARDMGGHAPPVCYPAHGWTLESDQTFDTTCELGEFGRQPIRIYRMSRTGEDLNTIRLSIISAFLLPDGTWVRQLDRRSAIQGSRRLARDGVAQLQLASAGWPDQAKLTRMAEDLMASMPARCFAALTSIGTQDEPELNGND